MDPGSPVDSILSAQAYALRCILQEHPHPRARRERIERVLERIADLRSEPDTGIFTLSDIRSVETFIGKLRMEIELDPVVKREKKFRRGRPPGTRDALTKVLMAYLSKHPKASDDDVYEHLFALADMGEEPPYREHPVIKSVVWVRPGRTYGDVEWVDKRGEHTISWKQVRDRLRDIRQRLSL
jgi:hypothetical protein